MQELADNKDQQYVARFDCLEANRNQRFEAIETLLQQLVVQANGGATTLLMLLLNLPKLHSKHTMSNYNSHVLMVLTPIVIKLDLVINLAKVLGH